MVRQSVRENICTKRPWKAEGVEKAHMREAKADRRKGKYLCKSCIEENGPTQVHGCHLACVLDLMANRLRRAELQEVRGRMQTYQECVPNDRIQNA